MAEELRSELEHRGYGTTSDPDTMTTELYVSVVKKRDLGDASRLMRSVISKHLMDDDVQVEKV
jgi:repressor of nif and glnA expression